MNLNQQRAASILKAYEPRNQSLRDVIEEKFKKGDIDQVLYESALNQLETIEKAGEGSRGGRVIGHTKSGKPIYLHDTYNKPSAETSAGGIHSSKFHGWSKEDHMDALNHHIDEKNKINAKWHEESKEHIRSGRDGHWNPSQQDNEDRVNHMHNADAHWYHLIKKHGMGRDEMNAHVNKKNSDFVEAYKREHGE